MARLIRVIHLVFDSHDVMIALLELVGHTELMGATEGREYISGLLKSCWTGWWCVVCCVVLHGKRGCMAVDGYFTC
jgi:hypothetical protein